MRRKIPQLVHRKSPTFAAIARYHMRGMHAADLLDQPTKPKREVKHPCSPWPRNRGPIDYKTGELKNT